MDLQDAPHNQLCSCVSVDVTDKETSGLSPMHKQALVESLIKLGIRGRMPDIDCEKCGGTGLIDNMEMMKNHDWWCVVDFHIMSEPFILLRIGKKGSVNGEDHCIFTDDCDQAQDLWEMFNDMQFSPAPTLAQLKIMLNNVNN